jgi:hypothetical protein
MYRSLPRQMTLEQRKTRPLAERWVANITRLTSAVE